MSSKRSLRRARRMLRSGGTAVLNIVSLIDVFAILVFYLLVNALNPEVLPVPAALKLAESEARLAPQPTISVAISEHEIRIDGRLVASSGEVLVGSAETIRALRAALHDAGQPAKKEISIIADKRLPFRVLKQVMNACADEQYAHVSLAVVEKVEKSEGDGA
ncbi:ExbD/TolR family protein [Nevskia ramosa]|uniref:ExbD/TolR family protein n=1 Tax=Nevskia ramosa TaxID=64002 RepID=UPI002354F1EB|nr:biopolymer transporter ExbD [Nevskia ramosa]